MQATCPGCGAKVDLQGGDTAPDGRVRVKCEGCDARLLIKINRPDLKIDQRIPTTNGDGDAPLAADRSASIEALERFSIDVGSGEFSAHGAGLRVVVVQTLPEAGRDELKRGLIRVPRFSRNPNKVHDATAELPYVLTGLEQEEADALEALVLEHGGACIAGPEWRVLDEAGRPRGLDQITDPVQVDELFGEADEGLVVMGEADDEEEPSSTIDDELDELLVAGEAADDDLAVLGEADDDDLVVPAEADDDDLLIAGPDDTDGDDDDGFLVAGDDGHPPIGRSEQTAPPVQAPPPPSRKQPDWLGALARPVFPERRARRPAPEPAARPAHDLAPIEPAPEGEDDEPRVDPPFEQEELDPFELAPETYDDLVAVVTSDHLPSVEIPLAPVRLVTVDEMPEGGAPLGLVSTTVEVPPSAAAGSKAAAVSDAIKEAEDKLQVEARGLGASMIVAVRTTASDLVDGTLIVVMQGTATR